MADATDIFHDALIVYLEKENNIAIHTSIEAYLFGIAKHLWLKRQKAERSFESLSKQDESTLIIDETEPAISTSRLLSFLEATGKKCLDLLSSFYFEKQSLTSIVKQFGFTSEHSASVQKYKCIEKLRDVATKQPHIYESFFEWN